MKEIWKLIELLNEYQKENWPEWISFYEKNWYLGCQIEHYVSAYWYEDDYRVDMEYWVEILISKYFWFIKWLVENDKINTKSWPLYWFHFIMSNRQSYSFYETLLMILAISDTPIEDLLLYLK